MEQHRIDQTTRSTSADLVEELLKGSQQAAARLISLVEDRDPRSLGYLQRLSPYTGRAYVIGVTGPPGTGKSTLVDAMTRILRREGKRVGIIAVDPTSPFSGGAILADRIRMQDHSTDEGVFIRSMATRGSLGGLAPATGDAVAILDAMGYDPIFVETVGAGQVEVDIVRTSDSVIVVTVPGLGDYIQTLKAGIMEIGEIFVVNKADHGDAERTTAEIKAMLELAGRQEGWNPPVVKTVALNGSGVEEVLSAVWAHRAYQETNGLLVERRRRRRKEEILRILEEKVRERIHRSTVSTGQLDELAERTLQGELDPYSAADLLYKALFLPGS
ncbi:MAG: methylmalonyl Co-A mutase-associated GTPase MeaB [Armatimonadota bacterium]|nr:methylmalonyl Co-A mutase-associated GTPase MeaB [Armatimonadota bacterium]MDR5702949.1 methylmalonyl Co-A mutase-associated GTPase MeaB [Armatimonadota bacterium]MDR7433860.1 methylmalonyl Co-A mutase-associated GTPase MeaB [Armatimonadota bacterium]